MTATFKTIGYALLSYLSSWPRLNAKEEDMERPQPQLGTQQKTTGDRVLAWFVDTFILLVISILVASEFGSVRLFFLTWGVGSFGYHTFFEATYGQTFGKKAVDVVVIKEDGEPCDWSASIIRNVVRVIDSFLFYLVGIVVILLTENDQRLGDVAAGTIVTEVAPDEPGPKPKPKPESDFEIELHHDEALEERYVELLNKSGEEVDLSRGTLRTDSGSEFRFPQGETVHRPGDSKTFLVSDDFTIDPGNSVTLLTRSGRRYDVSWHEA
jgi:uncharacterized RDD family membrane protein YckC